jgi:hypothetical protein
MQRKTTVQHNNDQEDNMPKTPETDYPAPPAISPNGTDPTDEEVIEEPVDPFDPERLRYAAAEYASTDVPTKEVITAIKVRRPTNQEWFRLHREFQLPAALYLRESKTSVTPEPWLVQPPCWELFKPKHLTAVRLQLAISSVDKVFLWDRKVARQGEEVTDYLDSLQQVADAAEEYWVRMEWDNNNRVYSFEEATVDLGDPPFPVDRTFGDWLRLAFRDRNIDREDHPVVLEYRTGKRIPGKQAK